MNKTNLLKSCLHCGGQPKFIIKEKHSHTFWRIACSRCGCGTWCDNEGYGHQDDNGKELAILEWNQRII